MRQASQVMVISNVEDGGRNLSGEEALNSFMPCVWIPEPASRDPISSKRPPDVIRCLWKYFKIVPLLAVIGILVLFV